MQSSKFFEKKYRVFVPEDRELGLEVSFLSTGSGVNEYEPQEEKTVRLVSGESVVQFRYGKAFELKETPEESRGDFSKRVTEDMMLIIAFNGDQEHVLKHSTENSFGYSSSNYTHIEQSDYPKGKKLPSVLSFKPNSLFTRVIVRIVELSQ